ncbi:hypothetical protein ACFE04_023925 [Oxalis oulophora]
MGRAPCCDKANVKKGPWSPEEDAKLKNFIEEHGLKRCGKSCRLRWLNYLRPNIKHGGFTEEEDDIICSLYITIGSRWSIIASQLPGRTDNDIKNYWNTRLKKKLLGKQRKEQARRAASLKNEIVKKESSMTPPPSFINQTPYWPEINPHHIMPQQFISSPNQLEDPQASLKTYLINLGGRFSDDHYQQSSYPFDVVPTQDQMYYANSMSHNSMTNHQVIEDFPVDLTELLYGSSPEHQQQQQQQQLEANSFERLCEIMNGGSTSTDNSTISWGDVSENNLVYNNNNPQMVSDYEACQQISSMPEPHDQQKHASFQESNYFGQQ